jgi:hypothetical protein
MLELAHVGDSRAYMIRGKQIHRVTRDHSYIQELIDSGKITEKEAFGHPESNKITRALGMTPTVQVETRSEPLELFDGDVFILATDGLTDLARNEEILVTTHSLLKTADIQAACNELVALANRRGGHDNITVQVIRVAHAGPKLTHTQAGAPVRGRSLPPSTLVQTPAGHTTPGLAPTQVDSGYGPSPTSMPLGPHSAPPFGGPHGPPPSLAAPVAPPGPNPLMNVVLAMAVVIGLLLAALVWALKLR